MRPTAQSRHARSFLVLAVVLATLVLACAAPPRNVWTYSVPWIQFVAPEPTIVRCVETQAPDASGLVCVAGEDFVIFQEI